MTMLWFRSRASLPRHRPERWAGRGSDGSLWRRFAGVSVRLAPSRPAECNKAPFMYEMKGALSGHAAPDRPVARPPWRCAPPRQGQAPPGNTGFPAFPAPRGCPRMVPVSNGESISTPSAQVTQEPAGIQGGFFPCPHVAHRIPPVIRILRRLSTGLCTSCPQVTSRTSEKCRFMVALCNRPVFSRRRSVSALAAALIGGVVAV